MRIAITGSEGRLGKLLVAMGCVHTIISTDITKRDELIDEISSARPDIVIHLAAMTDVDWCEKNEAEARRVNFRGTFNVAEATDLIGTRMVFLSSDHIFDGKWGNYKEGDKPHPKNMYGLTKMTAEAMLDAFPKAKIIRTSKNFSKGELDSKFIGKHWADFPTFICRSFIYSKDFLHAMLNYITEFDSMPKILHLASRETMSWYDFALRYVSIYRMFGNDEVWRHVVQRKNDDTTYAPRPYRGGLSVGLAQKLGFKLPSISQTIENSYKDE